MKDDMKMSMMENMEKDSMEMTKECQKYVKEHEADMKEEHKE